MHIYVTRLQQVKEMNKWNTNNFYTLSPENQDENQQNENKPEEMNTIRGQRNYNKTNDYRTSASSGNYFFIVLFPNV